MRPCAVAPDIERAVTATKLVRCLFVCSKIIAFLWLIHAASIMHEMIGLVLRPNICQSATTSSLKTFPVVLTCKRVLIRRRFP